MDFEELQRVWQSEENDMTTVAGVDAVLREVQERHRRLMRAVLWRDVREIAASALGAGFLALLGTRLVKGGWPFYVAAALCLGVGLLLAADRTRQRRLAGAFGDSARDSINRALMQVNHQIWLLENVFWWYLLPIAAAYALALAHGISVAHIQSRGHLPYWLSMTMILGGAGLGVTIFCGVYWLNRSAVRKYLVPRRKELQDLARALSEKEQ